MRKILYIFSIAMLASWMMVGCEEKKVDNTGEKDSIASETPDTTLYGICGEGTSMHSLEIIPDDGKALTFIVDEDSLGVNPIKGGMLCGDKMAVITTTVDGEKAVKIAINLTTLEGKWTSLDRNFEILQGGEIISTVQSESNPYTSWRILNGQLLMGRDTFDILTLGADSLELENSKGIFVYKRQK